MTYNNDNAIKTELVDSIYSSLINNKDPINAQISFDAIQIETENLANREKIIFIINTIVTVCLFITIIKTM